MVKTRRDPRRQAHFDLWALAFCVWVGFSSVSLSLSLGTSWEKKKGKKLKKRPVLWWKRRWLFAYAARAQPQDLKFFFFLFPGRQAALLVMLLLRLLQMTISVRSPSSSAFCLNTSRIQRDTDTSSNCRRLQGKWYSSRFRPVDDQLLEYFQVNTCGPVDRLATRNKNYFIRTDCGWMSSQWNSHQVPSFNKDMRGMREREKKLNEFFLTPFRY